MIILARRVTVDPDHLAQRARFNGDRGLVGGLPRQAQLRFNRPAADVAAGVHRHQADDLDADNALGAGEVLLDALANTLKDHGEIG